MYLAHQFISEAYGLIGKGDSKPFPLQTVFLTSEVPALPSSMLISYERVLFTHTS
jgi:hypothetical protein